MTKYYWYLLLELDFEAHSKRDDLAKDPVVRQEIDEKVKQKKAEWEDTALRGKLTAQKNAKAYFNNLPDFLNNYNQNPSYASIYLKNQAIEAKEFVKEKIDDVLASLSKQNGFVLDNNIEALRSSLAKDYDYIDKEFIEKRIVACKIKYITQKQLALGIQKYLDIYNKYFECPISDQQKKDLKLEIIEKNLKECYSENVYHFIYQYLSKLGEKFDLREYQKKPCEILIKNAQDYAKKLKQESGINISNISNKAEAIAINLSYLFKSEETKELYNKYLKWKDFAELERDINNTYSVVKYFDADTIHNLFENIFVDFVTKHKQYFDVISNKDKRCKIYARDLFLACWTKNEYNGKLSVFDNLLNEPEQSKNKGPEPEKASQKGADRQKKEEHKSESTDKKDSSVNKRPSRKMLFGALGLIVLLFVVFNFVIAKPDVNHEETTAIAIQHGRNMIYELFNDLQKDYSTGSSSRMSKHFESRDSEAYKMLTNMIKPNATYRQQIKILEVKAESYSKQQNSVVYRVHTKHILYKNKLNDGTSYKDEVFHYTIKISPDFVITDIKKIPNPEETAIGQCVVKNNATIRSFPSLNDEAIGTVKRNETYKYTMKTTSDGVIWVRIQHPTRGLSWIRESDVVELNVQAAQQKQQKSAATKQSQQSNVKNVEKQDKPTAVPAKTEAQKQTYTLDKRDKDRSESKVDSFMSRCASSSRRKERMNRTIEDYVKTNSPAVSAVTDYIQSYRYSVRTTEITYVSFDSTKREVKYNVYQKAALFDNNTGDEVKENVDMFFEVIVEAFEPYKVISFKTRTNPVEMKVIAEGVTIKDARITRRPNGGNLGYTLKPNEKVKITGERQIKNGGLYYRIYNESVGLGWIDASTVGNITKPGTKAPVKKATPAQKVTTTQKAAQPKKQAAQKVQRNKPAQQKPTSTSAPKRQGPPPGM